MKYTPGPWEYEEIRGADMSMVYAMNGVIAGIPNELEEDEMAIQNGNANLIAAAPDMREALDAFESWWRLPASERTIEAIEPAMRLCLNAIAKAEGNGTA